MTLGSILLALFGIIILFQLFMMYVMYRCIRQQQDEIDLLQGKTSFSEDDLEMLIKAARNVADLR
ncbi:hypothetical protein ABH15_11985 [Methanoculleus taiwanensis]|uniref:Uncharacterized protein n=1 Tax=Methanoculleus taiwanensis TaxID=1550565 RepID=A0A498GXD1_9EURY|nr:hypothetical protein [Methanoculleus taiwanensis]RXE55449.1 hypothetical protein ABH15_11985 [Methanoculleus taiwanensis]